MRKYINYYPNVDIRTWANNTLTPQEQEEFYLALTANNNLWDSYKNNGLITFAPVYESVYLDEFQQHVNVQIGEEILLAPGVEEKDLQLDPEYEPWLTRYHYETQTPYPFLT